MKTKTRILAILAALGLFGGVALAQPIPVPQVQSVGPNDLFQDVVGGVPQPGNAYASGALLTASFGGYGDNFLIGGDPGVNLWQRGTPSGTLSYTAAPVYTADRWFAWSSLTGTTFTVAQVTTAAALPTGVQDAMQVKMSNSQTGTGQVCVGQVIASASAYKLAGHTVEFDFNTYAGATFNLSASAINAAACRVASSRCSTQVHTRSPYLTAGPGSPARACRSPGRCPRSGNRACPKPSRARRSW